MLTHCVILDQEYNLHTNRHRFPKIFQNGTEHRKARRVLSSVRVYLFVSALVTIIYIVLLSSTKRMILTSIDIGSQKSFKMEPSAERLIEFWWCDSLSFWYACDYHIKTPKTSKLYMRMYRVLLCPNQEYDLHTNRHWFPKIFQNRTERRKARRILVVWKSISSLMRS